jgi:hypothetical protein
MVNAEDSVSARGRALLQKAIASGRSPEQLMYLVMEARAVPNAGRVDSIEVTEFRRMVATHHGKVEDKIADYAKAVNMPARLGETPSDIYYRRAAGATAMRALEHTAEVSRDEHELDYAAMAVIEQRRVILKLAQNPYISEATQLRIVSSPLYQRDPYVGRALAANPAITPNTARVIARHFKEDRFVMHTLGDTLSKLARHGHNAREYAEVCREVTTVNPVDFPLAAAVAGVDDSEHLRRLWHQYMARPTLDRNLDRATFHALAQNPNTPNDVIVDMVRTRPASSVVGGEATITNDALHRRIEQMNDAGHRHEHEAPRPS